MLCPFRYMAYIIDTNEEERVKGKTVEVGRAHFETESSRFTILDAPGHKSYVLNMISGASQADVGVLVLALKDLIMVTLWVLWKHKHHHLTQASSNNHVS